MGWSAVAGTTFLCSKSASSSALSKSLRLPAVTLDRQGSQFTRNSRRLMLR